MSSAAIARMRNPPAHPLLPLSPLELMGLEMFLARGAASEENYSDNRRAFMRVHPEDDVPSYDRTKRLMARATGIEAIKHDMCYNTCIAYTGPFDQLTRCPICPERKSRYVTVRGKRVARRTFSTFPVGPQLQILRSSPETAKLMQHRRNVTREVLGQGRVVTEIDDLFQGRLYLDEVDVTKNITDDDMVLMLSIDGAQLYASKGSDCWFLIWVVFDLPPEHRYKKRFVLPAGVIPGPNKPKLMDSFLFPTFYHLSAVQREGLVVYDALAERIMRQNLYVVFATADTTGLVNLSGGVGHQGYRGCRTACDLKGRHKPGSSTYYPAMLLPDHYTNIRGRHPDVNYRLRPESAADKRARYVAAMASVLACVNEGDYEHERCETGVGKPSIICGLRNGKYMPIPNCFPIDFMHLLALNLTELLIALFRATLACANTDTKDNWPWACFRDSKVWDAHGAVVAEYSRYIPGSFGHTPRNIAQKITSGYKAEEWMLYMWVINPGLLLHALPRQFFIHFCRLVAGVRVACQRSVKVDQIGPAQELLVTYVEQFEAWYYRRRLDRLHFVRPCIHLLVHLLPEVHEVGSGPTHSQWTMENYIGNVTAEGNQHVTPQENITQRAELRVQASASYIHYIATAN